MPPSSSEEPPSPNARAATARAPALVTTTLVHLRDPAARAALQGWLDAIPHLERRPLAQETRLRLGDSRRICEELLGVLDGVEDGEGRPSERTLHLAIARGRVQGACSMFACPDGTFIELLASAPWNALGPADPPDPRTVRGAGSALIAVARRWSAARGHGGRVALQAENPRAAAFYERLGFRRMAPSDAPLSLVPPGKKGWSPSIQRLARGRAGGEEARSPWMLLAPDRAHDARAHRAPGAPAATRGGARRG